MKTTYIKSFEFDNAQYLVSDGETSLVLKVNYKNNKYEIEHNGKSVPAYLKKEASAIAEDLLERKHGVNFAERE
ncbi:hypothetical protein A2415_02950 [candidate division WWE3 bacterium RIFOXYC1_FULL_39_7]|uniref:Uncharacterized protein n=2 Tax=Katanobacteria TaxID=422282 RepID=A0A1F4X8K3_UNCKA|nr:MAG: hypothetical protein A2415_02950 [candidate division WWE3 bacterium RIFOXYC1_FULL_39_7]OGC77992.1 MAG: hypothetical protein A2619_02795 [candidate division WWE3 bacterium RIFOXYD1_FULL_39_9]